jgi:hypothetical protein
MIGQEETPFVAGPLFRQPGMKPNWSLNRTEANESW